MKLLALAPLLILIFGCSRSLDARYESMCTEMKARTDASAQSEGACKYRSELSAEVKEGLIQTWEQFKAAEIQLRAIEEAGRKQGFTK